MQGCDEQHPRSHIATAKSIGRIQTTCSTSGRRESVQPANAAPPTSGARWTIPARYRTGGDRPAWHAPAPAGGGPFRVRQGGGLVCCDEAGSRPGSWRPVLPARHQALRFFSATVAGAASGEPLDERPHSVQSSTTVRERVFHVKHVRRRPTVCPAAFHVKHDQPRALLRPVADPISGETVTLKPGMVRAPNGSRVPVEEP